MSAINPASSSGSLGEKRAYEPSMEEILASIRRIIADDQGGTGRGGDAASTLESSRELLRAPAAQDLPQPPGHTTFRQAPRDAIPRQAPPSPTDAPDSVAADDRPAPAMPQIPRAHGPVAAPQYPGPDGRTGTVDRLMPPHVAESALQARPPEPAPEASPDDPMFEHDAPDEHPTYTAGEPAFAAGDDGAGMFDEPIEPQPPKDASPLFSAATDAAVSSAFSMLAASRLAANSEELMTIAKEMIRPLLRAWLDDNLPSMVERMVRAEIERVARGGR